MEKPTILCHFIKMSVFYKFHLLDNNIFAASKIGVLTTYHY